jgi:hypothetical protein
MRRRDRTISTNSVGATIRDIHTPSPPPPSPSSTIAVFGHDTRASSSETTGLDLVRV